MPEPQISLAESDGFNSRELSDIIGIVSEYPRSKGHGMSISATEVRFEDATMWVSLSDDRILGVPFAWFSRLLSARASELLHFQLSSTGFHWEDLDEDISIAGFLAGRGDQTRPASIAAE